MKAFALRVLVNLYSRGSAYIERRVINPRVNYCALEVLSLLQWLLAQQRFCWRTLCAITIGFFCSTVVVAEPVLVLGSFTEKNNAQHYSQRVESQLDKKAHLVETILNRQLFYRVVVATHDSSVVELKQRAKHAGFLGVWSWVPPVAMNVAEASTDVLDRKIDPPVALSGATSSRVTNDAQQKIPQMQSISRAPSKVQTNISGYLKSYAVAQDAISNSFFATGTAYQSQSSGRLMLETFTKNTVFQLHYELSPLSVSRSIGGDLQFFNIVGDNYRLSDIETSLTNDVTNKTQFYQNLDRLNFQWRFDAGDLTIGRQAVSFGGARYINPTDVFSPFDTRTFNTEYRTGVDAVRFQKPWGDLGEVDIGIVLGADGKRDNSAAFMQISNNFGGADYGLAFIEYARQSLFSLSLQTEISATGFWFEGAYVEGEVVHFRGSTGLDYAFSENTLGMIEYHYNGAGSKNTDRYLSLYDTLPYQRGGVFLLGENYLLPSFSFQATPLLSLAMQAVVNLDDASGYTSLSAEYNVAENFYIDFAAYFFVGDDLTITPLLTPMLGSEYGANPHMLYSSIRWYF